MNDEFAEAVAGMLAAQGFVLENLYALLLAGDPDPVAACHATAQHMLRDFGSLRPTGVQTMSHAEIERIRQHALDRLTRFWNGVERRLTDLPQD
ncbi:hypothetical protein [Sphingomonas sp. RIT328]|uniref:hypothetical protein n=1 Tax=Sphingomonas sp. RIT328 TaxID=1470591 RepID=UPI00044B805D|nr:hypothetical protein [Sphingomonas sp. RIT328]EZP53687.1 hypothetical protein BW41_01828 [Sphingomonas sp. RIT328]EZP53722.1 hypothetical protein BW41_01863 [Sphingomonas sp. RIT328]